MRAREPGLRSVKKSLPATKAVFGRSLNREKAVPFSLLCLVTPRMGGCKILDTPAGRYSSPSPRRGPAIKKWTDLLFSVEWQRLFLRGNPVVSIHKSFQIKRLQSKERHEHAGTA